MPRWPGTRLCGELVSQNNGREVVYTASHTALTDHSGGLPGFYCGASGFSGDWKIQTDRTGPDSISAPAPASPTDERHDQMRKAGAGRKFPLQKYFEDHAPPEGGLGVPLNHPRFLEWVGAPASAWLLEMSPSQWCDTLSRDQAMTAAMQLHKDVCLMNTNLDILDQYVTASKILQKTIGGSPYPKAEVAAEAQGPRARRASVHMEILGLDPMQFDKPCCKTSIRDALNGYD